MKKIYLPLFSQIQGSKQKTLDRNDIWTIMQQIRVYEYTCMYIYIYIYYNIMHIYIYMYGTSSNHWRHLATIGFPNKKTMGFYRAIGHQPPPAASTSLPFRWGPDHSSARSGDPGALICRECQV